jgi:hypothetical protein
MRLIMALLSNQLRRRKAEEPAVLLRPRTAKAVEMAVAVEAEEVAAEMAAAPKATPDPQRKRRRQISLLERRKMIQEASRKRREEEPSKLLFLCVSTKKTCPEARHLMKNCPEPSEDDKKKLMDSLYQSMKEKASISALETVDVSPRESSAKLLVTLATRHSMPLLTLALIIQPLTN